MIGAERRRKWTQSMRTLRWRLQQRHLQDVKLVALCLIRPRLVRTHNFLYVKLKLTKLKTTFPLTKSHG